MGKLFLAVLLGLVCFTISINAAQHNADIEDNEFAEFEDLGDEDDDEMMVELEMEGEDEFMMDRDEPNVVANDEFGDEEDEINIEDEGDEFDDHFQDDEEFENFERDDTRRTTKGKGASDVPDLEITKVPMHLRNNWDSYYLELLMIAGIVAYLLNYMNGKSKNQKLAQAWFNSHKELLESNFALVGDDGQSKEPSAGPVTLVKESENRYLLWCSGRVCCEGMLVELKLLKRQDLISVIARSMKPTSDEIKITITMNKEDMDSFVLFVGTKKTASRMAKEMQDLSLYCPERRSGDRYGLSSSFSVLSEMGEVINGVLDSKVITCLSNNEAMFDYLHISDQFSGPKPSTEEEQPTKMPETKKVLIFNFKLPSGSRGTVKDMENMVPLMKMVIYCIDKTKRFRLSREGKMKADKARAKVSESYMKLAHQQRQEAAQARREDKRRADKERLMNEEDPDKARKLEEKQHRKDMRKRMNPGAKQVKVRVA